MEIDLSGSSSEPTATVLFLIHDLRPGGAERIYIEYLRRIQRFRIVPVLLRPQGALVDAIPAGSRFYDLETGKARLACAGGLSWRDGTRKGPLRDGILQGTVSLLVKSRRLAQIARRESADLVSTFLHKSHAVGLTAKLLWDSGLRVLVNIHEQPLQHLESHFPAARRPLMRAYYRFLLPRADRILTVATGVTDELSAHFGIPDHLMEVLGNPIDVRELRNRAERKECDVEALRRGSTHLVVGVGRLEWVKGFDHLIRAVGTARRSASIHLVLIGEGTERDSLQELATSLGLGDSISFLGYRENPLPLMSLADLLVVSSRTEAWPNVIGEALAVGTPILATRCSPGVEEFLDHGRFGELVGPDSVEELAAGILRLLEEPQRRRELVKRGTQRAWEFDSTSVVERYESTLAAALAGGSR